ncbi:MAG: methyl-accepting chemotaxis protein [Clostridium sp.]|nr:methyl-accepting chemotaxis protein [Clostridium sp.]MCM1569484.1 methyl-accepting chemotaxis protein [Roseburia sp.]
MKKKSIFRQLLLPMIAIVCLLAVCLTGIVAVVFTKSYEKEIYSKGQDKSRLVSGEIATFLDGAYGVTEELSVNPSILTMETAVQTPILEDCVRRNTYLELLYIQGTDGMQTGRSSGELADRSTRWWFVQTMEEQKSFVSKSYYSVNTGMPCASIFFPMYKNDGLVGIFAVDLKLDYLQSLIEEFSDVENGEYSFVIDGEGVVVAHPDSIQIEELYNYKQLTKTVSKKDEAGTPLTDADGNILTEEQKLSLSEDYQKIISEVMDGKDGIGRIKNEGEAYFVSYASISLPGESDSWSVITLQKEASAMAIVYRVIIIAALLALLIIAVAIFVIALLARRLTKPIVSITELIGNASEGDFTMRAEESSKNEIGTLSKSFNKMTGKISGILTKITTFTGEVVQSSGHLKAIEENVESISQAVREISDGTDAQNKDVNQVVTRAAELEEKFGQLREKSRLLLEDVQNTILSGESGMQNVGELKEQSEVTAQRMAESYAKITTLEEQSRKISSIVSTINEISSQTGLLALNATIEAARAGEQGRGFAVVAESIGKLAADSTEATANIESIIVELCRDIADTVTNIESIRNGVQGQAQVVDKVQETFMDFRTLAEKTRESVSGMEDLVVEMHKCDRSMVHAVERIHNISTNTAELTEKVADSLEEQLSGIHLVANRIDNLSMVSEEMEQEMTRFKLSK